MILSTDYLRFERVIFMILLYILGLLQRYGPQHGYQIKKTIAEQLSDFTHIKLPTIYYHLEKMKTDGLLSASSEKPGSRPEKTVYSITDKGIRAFKDMLAGLLDFDYRPVFPSDGVFYFSDYLETSDIIAHLEAYVEKLKKIIAAIQKHKNETMGFVPDDMKTVANIVFSHHGCHYRAELGWAVEALNNLE